MAPNYTMISPLNPTSTKVTLLLRATRIWEATNKETKALLHTDVVFIDEQASQIMVPIWNNQREDYFPLLKEGGIYSISNFRVVPAPKKYRAINTDLSLSFFHRTKVEPMEDSHQIPRFKFDLTGFKAAASLLWDTKNFLDVVGMVRKFSFLEPTANGARKLDVLLVDDRQEEIIVSLWEDKAIQFQQGLPATNGEAAFVIITGLLAKQYSGTNIFLSSGDATMSYFNLDHEPVKQLREKILGATGHTPATLPPPEQKRLLTTEENPVNDATIKELLDTELPAGQQVMRFLCEASIMDVSQYDGWYYNACNTCPRKIRFEHGQLYCDGCTEEKSGYKPRYKVVVVVKDDSGKTTFTLFNKEVERLISVPIETLIAEIGQDKLTNDVPPPVKNLIGKKCAFEVKVTPYNQEGREGYGVARLSEIAAPPPPPQETNQQCRGIHKQEAENGVKPTTQEGSLKV